MKIKKQNGITLIALVVTIVVLLILAGVTITMVLGEDGIIAQAKLAAEKTKQAEAKQEEDLQNLVEQLDKILEEEPTPPEPETTPGTTADDLISDSNTDIYGDYVEYGVDLNDNGDFTDDWRIFYVGEGEANGQKANHIYLIAADYVPNTCDELKDAKGSTKANMTANNSGNWTKCTSYWSSAPTYHCNDGHKQISGVDTSKAQCSFPELFMTSLEEGGHCNTRYYCSDHVGNDGNGGNPNSRCASALQCTGNWSSFKTGASNADNTDKDLVDYAIGGPTLEMWVESWDQKHGDSDSQESKKGKTLYVNGNNASGYGYYVGEGSTSCTTTYYDLSSTTGYDDTLYFPHKQYQNLHLFDKNNPDAGGDTDCYGYWLSSPSANNNYYLMVVYCRGVVYYNRYSSYCGVRPLVCLKSDVKLTEKADASEGCTVWDLSM